MPEKETFDLSGQITEQRLIDELSILYAISRDYATTDKAIFLDTFDWRLFNNSLVLYQSGSELIVRQLATNQILSRQSIKARPTFIKDFPAGNLRLRLAPIIEMRALLPIAEADLHSSGYRVLNKDEKTVVRLTYETVRTDDHSDDPATISYLHLHPIRGYDKQLKKLKNRLGKIGAKADFANLSRQALAWSSRTPGGYTTKLKLPLTPNMPSDEATKIILRFLLQVIKRNEFGIKQDIDTEFLHDFRVAVRRTRSALSQIKEVFPEETTVRFKRDFSYIGKLSNELRDLDVYLLAEESYKSMLPELLQPDIDPLFTYLKKKRVTVLRKVIKELAAKKYITIMKDWEDFLNKPKNNLPSANQAKLPIIELARIRIYKKYRQIIKQGTQIVENAEDEQLHSLRVECKKLRYLLEFFANLFSGKDITALTEQLKTLQNNLGDFNDLCVQEDYLLSLSDEMSQQPTPVNVDITKVNRAVGYLIGVLHQERKRVKAAFVETFANFATPNNQTQFKKLFRNGR